VVTSQEAGVREHTKGEEEVKKVDERETERRYFGE